ncbi:MAG: ribosome biogenesis GTPase YlqF [Rhodopirellula sp.]|jgi:ribosome biogenesis GTPase A|nr:ribosome biogenesis GTPase YlqF [Rhodopirellula sp.]MCR9207272.1 ribosome biogenesis GTPase YlqF [bacterium]|tara:strand:+ start:2776 stop:3756 length:981 start_codon:yes stop_codon:yes gene_type:complete
MSIQWFPGHMHKARLEIQAALPKVDVVMEIIDARIPYSSENPMLADIRGDKACLKVLTKSDLADPHLTEEWLDALNSSSSTRARSVTTDDVPTIRRLKSALIGMCPHRKGRSINAMVMGIPNVGKSTIINFLAGRKVAKTGNTPAVTQHQQRVDIGDGVILWDTPGMLWPKVHNVSSGYRLALIGSIKDTAMDYTDVGFFAARYFMEQYPDRLAARFDLESVADTEMAVIEDIGRRRGCLGRNNRVDLERASRILIQEYRTGGLGRLTLETPATMQRERILTQKAMVEAEEAARLKDEKRKKRFKNKQKAQRKSREMDASRRDRRQ